jgi:hypothetical protein
MPWVVLVRGDAEVACWPLPAGQNPDLRVVDQLARLQLAAGRLGCSLRLRGAPSQLLELIDLAGLSDIVTDAAAPVSTDPAAPVGTDPAASVGTDAAAPVITDPAGPLSTDPTGQSARTPTGGPTSLTTTERPPAGPADDA